MNLSPTEVLTIWATAFGVAVLFVFVIYGITDFFGCNDKDKDEE
jgi:hypothetical protein